MKTFSKIKQLNLYKLAMSEQHFNLRTIKSKIHINIIQYETEIAYYELIMYSLDLRSS